jgi:DNA-binding NarL/FixJ family response regulator
MADPSSCGWAKAAFHLDLLDEAVADLQEAVKACASNGAAGFHAEAQCELAAVLARRDLPGDAVQAREIALESAGQARELGMLSILRRATTLVELFDSPQPSLSLTRREHEVAELVARGLTNRDIATQLYLSERTAQNHVQHILTKLGMSNRHQIAAWMANRTVVR